MDAVNPVGPQAFADQMTRILGATPFWVAPSAPSIQVNQLADPSKPSTVVASGSGGFSGAIKAALSALDPAQGGLGSTSGIIAQATAPVGKSAAKALDAGADSLKAAGGGIASGFKWAMILILLGLASYVFLLASPYLPKPAGK